MNSTIASQPALSPVVTRATAGRVLDMSGFGHKIVCKVTDRDTFGAFSLAHVVAQTGGGVPLHVHQHEEETFYILEGRFSFAVGDTMIEAGPGDTVFGPRQIAHSWLCTSADEGQMVIVVTPGNFENFLAALPTLPAPTDPAFGPAMETLCTRYAVSFGGEAASDRAPFVPAHVLAGEGTLFENGDHRVHYKVTSAQTGGAFLLMEADVDPGCGVPPHIHSREDETFYVIAGRVQVQVGDQVVELGVGDTAFAPRNVMHTWRCVGDTPGRVLVLSTPGENFENFFTAMNRRGAAASDAMRNPDAVAAFMALAESHGIEMIAPIK